MKFDEAFHKLLGHEGGYSNHPSDPGGETMWGVTARVARANGYSGPMKSMPVEFAKLIYRRHYWEPVKADDLPGLLRYPVFDAAVNSGPEQAVKWLQAVLGAAQDGKVGPHTLAQAGTGDAAVIAARFNGRRLRFMADLPTWPAFGKGWARRIASLLEA